MEDKRLRGKARWSMSARCPRMGAYGLLGVDPEPPDDVTRLRWARGKLDEDWWVKQILAPRVGRRNIKREKSVPWPSGEGVLPVGELHTDVFVKTERMPYEVKSHLSGEPMDTDFVQLAGEVLFDPEVDGTVGTLVVIDRDLHWEAVPVLADQYREQVEETARQVIHAGLTGEVPERVCAKPSDARGRLCPFASRCFEGWSPPEPQRLKADAAVVALQLKHAQDTERELRGQLAQHEERRKELSGMLAEWDLTPGVEYVGAGARVTRTHVDDSERLSVTKARKAGVFTGEIEAVLAPFVTRSGAHDRWKIMVDRDAPFADDDFGSEAPWTDEDLLG